MKEISVTHRYEYRGGDGDIRQFFVLFTTGNVYTVDISNKNTCTCPDALKGNEILYLIVIYLFISGNLCKHVLFVMLKVLRVDPNDSCVWQTALLNSELHSIFTNAPPAPRDVYAAARARDGYQNMVKGEAPPSSSGASNRRPIEGQDCPICFDSLNVSDDIVFCEDCGNNMHKDCMRRWTSLNPTCPFCRAQWKSERLAPGAPHVGDEGYVNLARLQPGTDASRQYNPNKWRENLW